MGVTIPAWMDHLKTDRRGLPVPRVNLWGEENAPDRMDVRWDPYVGMRAVFLDDEGQEVPDFTRQHMGRQRESVAQGLCQVCWREVPWSRRFLVLSEISIQWIEVNGEPHMAVTEPWLCERCAVFAVDTCPALIRRRRDEKLRLVKVTTKRHAQYVVSQGWVEGKWEAETKADPVGMWAKILLDPAVVGG